MELIVALVLFIGLIASWLLLPGSTGTPAAAPSATASTVAGSSATQPV